MKFLYEATPEAAAKLYAKQVGDHGHSGGWIHAGDGRPITHGWVNYAIIQQQRGVVITRMVLGQERFAINWTKSKKSETVTCRRVAHPIGGIHDTL